MPALDGDVLVRFENREIRRPAKNVAQLAVVIGGEMLDDNEACRGLRRNFRNEGLQCLDPARGCANGHDRVVELGLAFPVLL